MIFQLEQKANNYLNNLLDDINSEIVKACKKSNTSFIAGNGTFVIYTNWYIGTISFEENLDISCIYEQFTNSCFIDPDYYGIGDPEIEGVIETLEDVQELKRRLLLVSSAWTPILKEVFKVDDVFKGQYSLLCFCNDYKII